MSLTVGKDETTHGGMKMARITFNNINKALSEAGISAELHKGVGYYYFSGEAVDYAKEQGVYGLKNLTGLSIEQWIEEARERII